MKFNYQNYIWDLGGTLMDNYESSSHAFVTILWQLGRRVVDFQEVHQALKVSTAYAIEKFASDLPDFLVKYKALESITLQKPILFDGAQEVLEKITREGKKNFMISHRDKQVLDILRIAGIDQYFTEVVTADNGFARKPSPESTIYLLQKYALDSKTSVMIGDRSIDIKAGQAAGTEGIFFDEKKELPEANHSIHSLRELL